MRLRRFLSLLWGALLAAATVCAQPVSSLYDKAEYRIAMRDSVHLHTSVYTPKAPGRAPIIIFRTPYGTGPYGAGKFPAAFDKAMSTGAISSSGRMSGAAIGARASSCTSVRWVSATWTRLRTVTIP